MDVRALEEELKSIEAQRLTADERLRLFSQRGRGRGRGRSALPGRHESLAAHSERKGGSSEGLSQGLRERLGSQGEAPRVKEDVEGERPFRRREFGGHDWRETFQERNQRISHQIDRYDPGQESAATQESEALPGSNKGRLASAIVVDAAQQIPDSGPPKRPLENGSSNPAIKQRNKRLFGSLLGTLQKFQEEDQRFKRSRLAQSRAEAEQRAEQRAVAEAEKLREQQRQDIAKARLDELNKRRELDLKLQAKRHEIIVAQGIDRETKLAGWLRTAARPALLWLPKFHNEDTQLLLEQRQADLDAWKEAQLSKVQNDKAQIEARFQPILPKPRPGAATTVDRDTSQSSVAAPPPVMPESERYEAVEDAVELEEEVHNLPSDDLVAGEEVQGVTDLL